VSGYVCKTCVDVPGICLCARMVACRSGVFGCGSVMKF